MATLNINKALFDRLADLPHNEAIYEGALLSARAGFKVLPLKENSKNFVKNLGTEYATDNEEIIKHWFDPKSGMYRGYNLYGIPPDPIIVLDCDRHGKNDAFANTGLEMSDLIGTRVLTPSGGCHFYTSDSKVTFFRKTPGVDRKTSGNILPPSAINGQRYVWDWGGEPGSIPEKMLIALGGKTKKDKQAEIEEFASVASTEFLEELISHFDPDCDHDLWVRLGMALHDNDPGEGHLAVWVNWSSRSEKFKPGWCETKWASFRHDKSKRVTLAWMIYEARKLGREPNPNDTKFSGINIDAYEAVMKMNERFMYTIQGGHSIITFTKNRDGSSCFTRTSPSDFKGLVASNLTPILVGDRYTPAAVYWLGSKYRREGNMVMEYPGEEAEGDYNMYQGFAIKPVPCDPSEIQFFLDHTLNVICNGDKEHCEFLLDMLAFKFQRPLDLVGTALVLAGKEGTGKSGYGEFIRLIVGPHHSLKVSTRDSLLGPYSGGIAGKIFVVGEEAVFSAHKGEAERLKALITESPLDYNEKFVRQWNQRNCLFLMFTTNENWAVPAGMDSRRFFVLKVSDTRKKDREYWLQYFSLLGEDRNKQKPNNPEYLGKVLYYFLNRKVTRDVSEAPITAELLEQRKLTNMESMEAAFVEWVRRVFVWAREDEEMFTGVGDKENAFSVVSYKDEYWIENAKMYADFKEFYRKHCPRGRGVGTEADFKNRLSDLGMISSRIKKGSLKVGSGRYPGNPTSQVRLVRKVDQEELEKQLAAQYPLFYEYDDEETD